MQKCKCKWKNKNFFFRNFLQKFNTTYLFINNNNNIMIEKNNSKIDDSQNDA